MDSEAGDPPREESCWIRWEDPESSEEHRKQNSAISKRNWKRNAKVQSTDQNNHKEKRTNENSTGDGIKWTNPTI